MRNLLRKKPITEQPAPSLPPIYAAPGHKHALKYCIVLASEELAAIDQLHAPQGSVEKRDLAQMRANVAGLLREFKADLGRIIEPVIPEYDRERQAQVIADRDNSIRHNVRGLRPHIEMRDQRREYRDAARYRVQLITVPLRIEKGELV